MEADGSEVGAGIAEVPEVPPGTSTVLALPDALVAALSAAPAGTEVHVTTRVEQAGDTAWAPAGHVLRTAQWDATGHALAGGATARPAAGRARCPARGSAAPTVHGGVVRLGPARLDARTGRLVEIGAMALDGPRVELWRAPTDNDRGAAPYGYERTDPALTGGAGDPLAPSSESLWRAAGLDRLVHRTVVRRRPRRPRGGTAAVRLGDDVARAPRPGSPTCWTTTSSCSPRTCGPSAAGRPPGRGSGSGSTCRPTWSARAGSARGPRSPTPTRARPSGSGVHAAGVDDLVVPYARPQESGHRPGTRWLELDPDGDGPGLSVRSLAAGHGAGGTGAGAGSAAAGAGHVGFTARRHTAQEVDRAAHPHELPAAGPLHLYLDAAQHGLGSRACGPDVLPRHALWPGTHRLAVALRVR